MNTDEGEWPKSVSQLANTADAGRPIVASRGQVLGIVVVAVVFAEVSKDIVFATGLREWHPACNAVYCGMLACLPFLLARMAPKAAAFTIQWLPSSRWQWAWFLGMVVLLMVSKALVAALAAAIVGQRPQLPAVGPTTPIAIVFLGIVVVLIAPIAEEIFFRGFLLDQLRKLTRPSIALLIQSLLFGLSHLYTWGLFTSLAVLGSINAFFFGLIVGAWRIRFRSLLPLVLAHVLLNAMSIVPLKARYDQAVRMTYLTSHTISKETTYLTEPLRKDGAVDYVAALNQRFSQGVTPENNAAALFWKVLGPKEILPQYRDKYFQMLGIPPVPEEGDYFVDLRDYIARQKNGAQPAEAKPEVREQDGSWEQMTAAMKRPWSREEFPVFAEWLAANEKPLALAVEASKRPRRYEPLCCGEKTPIFAVLCPAIRQYRDVAAAFCVRAMLRLDEGKVEEAWEDLLACHRLARLAGQGPTVVDVIIAGSIEEKACCGDLGIVQHANLSKSQIVKMRQDIDQLSAMPRMADGLDAAERFTYLNAVSDISRQGIASLTRCDDVPELDDSMVEPFGLKNTVKSLIRYGASTEFDWDFCLREGNSWFDRIADAYGKPTRAEQREALGKIDEDFGKVKATAADAESLDAMMLDNPRRALSERLSQVLLTIFLPSVTTGIHAEDRWIMRFELDKLAFALAAYRADRGAYPAKLADLTPGYVAEVSKDVCVDSELHYRLEGDGYLLYSVGINGKDDGAKYQDGRKDGNDWDDLVVRVPAVKQE